MAWWRNRGSRRPLRQYWSRTPTPTDALTGYVPGGLGLVDEGAPGEIYPDEVDPAWRDDSSAQEDGSASHESRAAPANSLAADDADSEAGQQHGQVT